MPRVRVCAPRYLAVEVAVGRGEQREEGALWDMKEEREGGEESKSAWREREGGREESRKEERGEK